MRPRREQETPLQMEREVPSGVGRWVVVRWSFSCGATKKESRWMNTLGQGAYVEVNELLIFQVDTIQQN